MIAPKGGDPAGGLWFKCLGFRSKSGPMRTDTPQPIRLAEYQPPAFLIDETGIVRNAWYYETGDVPDVDEWIAACSALRS